MKKLITLAVAGCMVLGSLATASAVDVTVAGQFWQHFGYYSNNALVKKSKTGNSLDRTMARQRTRVQIGFVADENLSALLNLEANAQWGTGGGALDADKATFVIKRAHIDWTLPNTQVKTRMGIQGIAMPSATFGNPVMNADVAGVMVSSQLTDELGLNVFWARPYDDNFSEDNNQVDGKNRYDEMDVFGVTLPIKTSVVNATPWGMFALIGKDSGFYDNGYNFMNGKYYRTDSTGAAMARGEKMDSTSTAWWAGTTLELPILDPFFVNVDAMMGGLDTGDDYYDTFGWMVAADIGYKFSFGSLSVMGWYSSGDKEDDDRGQMPVISNDSGFAITRYGMAGGVNRSVDGVLSNSGIGMWGLGLRLADMSFVDNLKHTVSFTYMRGTNKGDAIDRRDVRSATDTYSTNMQYFGNRYYMSDDTAYEVDLLNEYKVNEYLTLTLDFAYLWLDLGDHWKNDGDTSGSFATMIGVQYSF